MALREAVYANEYKTSIYAIAYQLQKCALAYRRVTIGRHREFVQISSIQGLKQLLGSCSSDVIEYLNKQINLEKRAQAAAQSPRGF